MYVWYLTPIETFLYYREQERKESMSSVIQMNEGKHKKVKYTMVVTL